VKLTEPTQKKIIEMMSWFNSEEELRIWAGPSFRYPYDLVTFIEDLSLDTIKSFFMVSKESELLAFGQYYDRLNRCHLGRLVVAPKHRGKNIVAELMTGLIGHGTKILKLSESSLFVMTYNEVALNVYLTFGFKIVEYPEKMPLDKCYYMVK